LLLLRPLWSRLLSPRSPSGDGRREPPSSEVSALRRCSMAWAASCRTCSRAAISKASKSRFSTAWRPNSVSISSTMSRASRSAKSFFFSLGRRDGLRRPQFGRADLLVDRDQFPHQLAKAAVFRQLRLGAFDGWSLRNHLGDGLSPRAMGQRIGGTVSWRALLGAVAVGFAAFAEPGRQKTRTQVVQVSQASRQLIAFFLESF